MSIPDERCGFILTEKHTTKERISDRQLAYGPYYDFCCYREVWRDHDHCIWHAQVEEKPTDELVKARTEEPERLDGSYLEEVRVGDTISFEDCTLHHASFDRSNLEGIDLSGAEANYSSFSNCQMSYADLTSGRFIGADFSNTNMQIVSASRSSLSNCDFSEAIVDGVFKKCDIMNTDFSKSEKAPLDLRGSRVVGCDFSESLLFMLDMRYVSGGYNDFSDSDISGKLSYSKLDNTDFSECKISNSEFVGTHLENCDFTNAIISESNFERSDLFGSLLQNVRVDRSTTFGQHYLSPDRPGFDIGEAIELNSLWESKLKNWGGEDNSKLIEKRIWTLETLQEIKERNTRVGDARKWYLRRKDAQREFIALSGKWFNPNWWVSTSSKYIIGYGEKPANIILASITSILLFAVGYSSLGGVDSIQTRPLSNGDHVRTTHVLELLESLYFSSITFSTLGYGDTYPATWPVRILATVESFVGALMMALLVFVLGRRATW